MAVTPMAVTFLVLSLLAMGWLTVRERIMRLNHNLSFHVSTYQRDRRKARFYALSVWIGIIAAFVGMFSLDFVASSTIEPPALRQGILGLAYGIGLWGLLIVAMVWSQVAHRVAQPNSDGKSLIPAQEEKAKTRW
jgi:hypothetical protein